MTVLCAGDCHIYLGSSSLCTCEAHRVAMYGYPSPYNPFSPHAPQPATPPEPCDVPLARLHAAQRVGGECLSADGMVVFTVRYGRVLQAEWKGNDWGAWLDIGEEMPAGAVVLK